MAPTKAKTKSAPKFTASHRNPFQIVAKVREGIPYSEFKAFQRTSGLSVDRIAKVAGVSKSSLMRRQGKRLNREESAALVRLERLYTLAIAVFEDDARAKAWLQRENPALEWKSPLDFADTDVGARQVESVLTQLEHGVF